MGTNFHDPYVDSTTVFEDSNMNAPLSSLDRAISYLKNVIVHCDGEISYELSTGTLAWSGTLRILFVNSAGNTIQNTVAAASIVLDDSEFAYVDLNETDNTVLTMAKAFVVTGTTSNFKDYNRLVLAYRNETSNECFAINLPRTIPEPTGS